MLKKLLLVLFIACICFRTSAQMLAGSYYYAQPHKSDKPKTKPANYNSIGYNHSLNYQDIIVGVTSTSYKKFGTFISLNVGVQNWLMPTKGEMGTFMYEKVKANGWTITGNTEHAVAFMASGGLAIALTRKIPFYIGAGVTRHREFFEYLDPFDNNKPKWNMNDMRKPFLEMNYTAGAFIPVVGRVVLNIGYNHNPQSVFVGLAISGVYNLIDADEWWWEK